MASPRKKKMAKYMINDLLAIAKEQIIRLNPNLEKESILEKMAQEYADAQKEVLLKLFPQDEMKVLEKYKKAFVCQTLELPFSGKHGQLGLLLPEYWKWTFDDKEFERKPYKNLLNSVGYLEDVIKHWNNKEVEEYISKKSECIVCTSLVTLTDADVKIIKMNEKLLQEKENGSSAN